MSNIFDNECTTDHSIEDVYIGVHTGPILGEGMSGLVRMVRHKVTGVNFAVKCLDLGLVETEQEMQQLREEIFIMCQLDHPYIVRLEEVYESESYIYLVQELCSGGDLFDRLDEQPDCHYAEHECARLVEQMLCAVRYIHSMGVIHRDLKLENFLFSTKAPHSELKLIDFGLSRFFAHGEVLYSTVGTPYTVAPEEILGKYNEKSDVWAIGVITYLLLSGVAPFGGCGGPESLCAVTKNILKGSFNFAPDEIWSHVSREARDFICCLLVTDQKRRPTAQQALMTPWIRSWKNHKCNLREVRDEKIDPIILKSLFKYREYNDLKKVFCAALGFTLLPDQIRYLRAAFDRIDVDGNGIELNDLKRVLFQSSYSAIDVTEQEVEEAFNAVCRFKSQTSIQWHDFIAASLSQCNVDDCNIIFAFNHLDSNRKGFISFDDVMNHNGNNATDKESLRSMYLDSCKDRHAGMKFKDFLFLMKGHDLESLNMGIPDKKSKKSCMIIPWKALLKANTTVKSKFNQKIKRRLLFSCKNGNC